MDDVFVRLAPLPTSTQEMVAPCADGYNVYIADWLDDQHRIAAYEHALRHIQNDDFAKSDVQQIEEECHAES